ncbi:MAG: hypothetical protein ACOYYF_12725 [Chloroflexota bacterium]
MKRKQVSKRQCPHRNTETFTTGGVHYSAGEVWDDIKVVTICKDCQRVLRPKKQKTALSAVPVEF